MWFTKKDYDSNRELIKLIIKSTTFHSTLLAFLHSIVDYDYTLENNILQCAFYHKDIADGHHTHHTDKNN